MILEVARREKLINSSQLSKLREAIKEGYEPEEALLTKTSVRREDLEELSFKSKVSPETKISAAFSILSYNQSILQFADDKANTLIVINSIFLASGGGLFKELKGPELIVAVLFFLVSAWAIAKCLMVVRPRSDKEIEGKTSDEFKRNNRPYKPDLIFFADIVSEPRAKYLKRFKQVTLDELMDQVTMRIYKASKIADVKYKVLNSAQKYTLIAAVLWLITMGFLVKSYLGM